MMTNTVHNDDFKQYTMIMNTVHYNGGHCTQWWWILYTMMMNTVHNDFK